MLKQFPVEFSEEKDGNLTAVIFGDEEAFRDVRIENHSSIINYSITGTIFETRSDLIPSITRSDMMICWRVARRQVEVRLDRKVAA